MSMFSLLHSSMLKRIGSGLFFSLFTVLYYVIILASNGNSSFRTTSCKAIIIPQILYGIAFAFILPTSLEFMLFLLGQNIFFNVKWTSLVKVFTIVCPKV